MKLPIISKIFLSLVFFCVIQSTQAALISSQFSDLGGNNWTVDLTLTNNSESAGINEFTLYFSESLYANLSVVSSPSSWDSFVAQPDLFLASPGFFDAYNPIGLSLGAVQSGFKIGFTFLGQGAPGELPFDIIGADFQPVSSGTSTVVAAQVVEPSALWLMLAGILVLAARIRRSGGAR